MQRPGPLFSADFYRDIAHKMDPEQEFSPEAISFLNEISDNFYDTILTEIIQYSKGKVGKGTRDQIEITEEDVQFIVEKFTGISLRSRLSQTEPTIFKPTAEYQEKLAAVRAHAVSQNED
ncbi:Transcription initiation factor TFIID subunit 12 [Histomonas meleagridis]|uniref:Transcription initiation factor TFIID subunit 12 n=1 Tax=Histomonas meleagridis TaxID=135588 RepID=UPI00355989E7|nr:Transcription initiation factor TFIID subunit 12 [Histomonas meleagridis]KAH0805403.1 Transcription initiation factor TFIID subunit 12 [Histomonas meleagridis]